MKDLPTFLISIYNFFFLEGVGKKKTWNSLKTMHGQSRGEDEAEFIVPSPGCPELSIYLTIHYLNSKGGRATG